MLAFDSGYGFYPIKLRRALIDPKWRVASHFSNLIEGIDRPDCYLVLAIRNLIQNFTIALIP